MNPETQVSLVEMNAVRCSILRTHPIDTLIGIVQAWSAYSLTLIVASHVGFRLNEPVVVKIDYLADPHANGPVRIARLYSRVISISWREAGREILELNIRAMKTRAGSRFTLQPLSRTPESSIC